MIIASPLSHLLAADCDAIASTDEPVLLLGETGTGKTSWARRIHESSARGARRLVEVNCARFAGDLVQAELFGHARGAFTGAQVARAGAIEEADGGTLFLDEVGDLGLEAQAMLLRALESGAVRRVGEVRDRRVDVRLIAATHRDLDLLVARGIFRRDLYYRIAVVVLRVAPLRDRREDMLALAREWSGTMPEGVADVLAAHPWPGNVRELHNVVRRCRALGCWTPEGVRRSLGASIAAPTLLEQLRAASSRLGWVQSGQLRRLTGLPSTTLRRQLRPLIDAGLIESTGKGRATRYRAKEDT